MNNYVETIAIPQVKEILSKCGDVAVLWWDTPTNMTTGRFQKLIDIVSKVGNFLLNVRPNTYGVISEVGQQNL